MNLFTTFRTLGNSNTSCQAKGGQHLEITSGITIEDITGPFAS